MAAKSVGGAIRRIVAIGPCPVFIPVGTAIAVGIPGGHGETGKCAAPDDFTGQLGAEVMVEPVRIVKDAEEEKCAEEEQKESSSDEDAQGAKAQAGGGRDVWE